MNNYEEPHRIKLTFSTSDLYMLSFDLTLFRLCVSKIFILKFSFVRQSNTRKVFEFYHMFVETIFTAALGSFMNLAKFFETFSCYVSHVSPCKRLRYFSILPSVWPNFYLSTFCLTMKKLNFRIV